ncbi:ribosomal RNA-processing protein 7 homolog A isoform 2-T2 [Anomaloglossus baeobatrachus]|uniref:ribosomal RNA-processing protein 7 homolog A isoform X2 n=1 Tax=Anomaloglossus baeobatrachus TaxID=238106 RepID=UPI003F50BE52
MAPSKEEPTFVAPAEYTVIPVQFSEEQKAHHCLYAKVQPLRGGSDKNPSQDRSLLVINVPAYVTKGFKTANIVFRKAAGIQKFRSIKVWTPLVISKSKDFVTAGIHKWIEDYKKSFVDVDALQAEIDTYMQEYDEKVTTKEDKAKEKEGVPDEDGWITVTRKGRRPGIARTEAINLRLTEKEKKKRAQKELLNFYAWQIRNKKKEHLAELRKKFEEDKQKIALMRAQRKFRPY